MKRTFFAWGVLVLAFPAALAQHQGPRPIRVGVNLVLVPATVERQGQPVRGLAEKDFVLLRDGKAERIEFFEEIQSMPARMELAGLPPHTSQNYAPAGNGQDVYVLVLDFLNLDPLARQDIRRQLPSVVRVFAESRTRVSVLVLSFAGLVQLHSLTSEIDDLVEAVDQWSTEMSPNKTEGQSSIETWANPLTPTTSEQLRGKLHQFAVLPEDVDRSLAVVAPSQIDRNATTKRALEQIRGSYGGIPGRKKLIWMSSSYYPGGMSDANIVVYPLLTRTGRVDGPNPSSLMSETLLNFSANGPWDWSRQATTRGGCPVTWLPPSSIWTSTGIPQQGACLSAPALCVRQVLQDASHYYLLGFYLSDRIKQGSHRLEVRVQQPGAKVRFRERFAIMAAAPLHNAKRSRAEFSTFQVSEEGDFKVALASPLDYTLLPLRLHWSGARTDDDRVAVELTLSSPPNGVSPAPEDGSLNLSYVAYFRPAGTKEGRSFPVHISGPLDSKQQASLVTEGFTFRKRFILHPGRYEVRVILRDNVAHTIGSISTVLDLPVHPEKQD